MLAYEPVLDTPVVDGVQLLGIESTRQRGAWPTLRHVFDLTWDAGLYVDVTPLGGTEVYAVGFDPYGGELLTPL